MRGNKRCHPLFLIVDVGTESKRVSANMQLKVSENTSRSEFSDHLLVSSTQNATKSGSKIHYVDFTIYKKRLRLELEETFAQSRSRVKMRKRRERDVLLWCTSHTKL